MRASGLLVAALAGGCDPASSPTPWTSLSTTVATTTVPPPPPSSGIVPIPEDTEGSVDMEIVSAEPPPGTRLAGCGPTAKRCRGRIRLLFELTAKESGWVQDVSAYLYGTRKTIACLYSRDLAFGPFRAEAGVTRTFEAVFDRYDDCPTPETIRALNVIVSGDVATSSRRGWLLEYFLDP